jgi:hypothetical protein
MIFEIETETQETSDNINVSHGYSFNRRLNSQIATELASHGYIIAAVDHEDCHERLTLRG